jgi:hypothetical protein
LDKKAWESADMECIQKWFKYAKIVTRIAGDPQWVAVVRFRIIQYQRNQNWPKGLQFDENDPQRSSLG